MSNSTLYVIDTSSLIDMKRRYPFNNCSTLWNRVSELIKSGRLLIIKEVYNEVLEGDDELARWLKKHRRYIIGKNHRDYKPSFRNARQILCKYPNLIPKEEMLSNKPSSADPYIIGLALYKQSDPSSTLINYDKVVVITEERNKNNKTNIPSVCSNEGIDCKEATFLIKNEEWQF